MQDVGKGWVWVIRQPWSCQTWVQTLNSDRHVTLSMMRYDQMSRQHMCSAYGPTQSLSQATRDAACLEDLSSSVLALSCNSPAMQQPLRATALPCNSPAMQQPCLNKLDYSCILSAHHAIARLCHQLNLPCTCISCTTGSKDGGYCTAKEPLQCLRDSNCTPLRLAVHLGCDQASCQHGSSLLACAQTDV